MAVLFPRIFSVIRRGSGSYVDGVWTRSVEPDPVAIFLNVQPATQSDYARLEAVSSGRRITAMMRAFAAIDAGLKVAGADGQPGDIVLIRGERWLVIGSAYWDSLNDVSTSHMRYMLALEAERAPGAAMA